jgi:hypothetical protein
LNQTVTANHIGDRSEFLQHFFFVSEDGELSFDLVVEIVLVPAVLIGGGDIGQEPAAALLEPSHQ